MFAELMADSVVRPVLQIDAFPPHEPVVVFISHAYHTGTPVHPLLCQRAFFHGPLSDALQHWQRRYDHRDRWSLYLAIESAEHFVLTLSPPMRSDNWWSHKDRVGMGCHRHFCPNASQALHQVRLVVNCLHFVCYARQELGQRLMGKGQRHVELVTLLYSHHILPALPTACCNSRLPRPSSQPRTSRQF